MYDEVKTPSAQEEDRQNVAKAWAEDNRGALVTVAAEGRKMGRLVVAMGPVDADVLARLAEGWRKVPMVTLVTGLPDAVALVERGCPGVFYNEGEAVSYANVRGFLPWLEVWMVGGSGAQKLGT